MTLSPGRPQETVGESRAAGAHSHDESDETRIQTRIELAIYEHRIKPGTKLPEIDLCRIYGTSRGVIRKVLDRLATEQLVDLIPNRGAFVARPSVENTRDTYSLRRILEAGVVRTLAKNSKKLWLDEVRLQVAEEREANRIGDNALYIRLAGKFHLDLAAATGNAALNQQLRRVVAQTSLMTALYDVPGTNTCSVHEHLEILDAIEAGDFANAERLMEDHLIGCERQLRLDHEEAPSLDLTEALGAAQSPPTARAPGQKSATRKSPARKTPARKTTAGKASGTLRAFNSTTSGSRRARTRKAGKK